MQTSILQMQAGEQGRVDDILCQGEVYRRLTEMGIVPNTVIFCIRKAPFAGAVEIYLRGYYLALGRQEAKSILIKKEGDRVCKELL